MKKLLPFLFLLMACNEKKLSEKNISFSYAPDSSSLSILLNGLKLNGNSNGFSLNLKNKWSRQYSDSCVFYVRGFCNLPNKTDSTDFSINLFGHNYQYTVGNGNYIFHENFMGASISNQPKIIVKSSGVKKNEKVFIEIDSYDLAHVNHNKN